MAKKLIAANPYLRNPALRTDALWISAKTSSAIEGIVEPFGKRKAGTNKTTSLKSATRARSASRSGGSQR